MNARAKKLVKNVVKAGVTMFAIGALLGVVVPALAAFLGPDLIGEATFNHLANTPVLQTGLFFGAFGSVSAVVTPAVNYLFGEREDKTVTAKSLGIKTKTLGYEQAPDLSALHDPSIAAQISATHFQDMVAASKASSPHIG